MLFRLEQRWLKVVLPFTKWNHFPVAIFLIRDYMRVKCDLGIRKWFVINEFRSKRLRNKYNIGLNTCIVRAHFRNFWLGKAFFSRIWHAVVLTQFGNADSKSAPCQAKFCVFPTQNSKTKWPPKLAKMSQLHIKAWLTMNIKTSFRCIKIHLSNILKVPWISPCAFAARGQNPKWPP